MLSHATEEDAVPHHAKTNWSASRSIVVYMLDVGIEETLRILIIGLEMSLLCLLRSWKILKRSRFLDEAILLGWPLEMVHFVSLLETFHFSFPAVSSTKTPRVLLSTVDLILQEKHAPKVIRQSWERPFEIVLVEHICPQHLQPVIDPLVNAIMLVLVDSIQHVLVVCKAECCIAFHRRPPHAFRILRKSLLDFERLRSTAFVTVTLLA